MQVFDLITFTEEIPNGKLHFCAHCVKSVQIRSFFWSECRKIQTRKNSVFGHFLRSGSVYKLWYFNAVFAWKLRRVYLDFFKIIKLNEYSLVKHMHWIFPWQHTIYSWLNIRQFNTQIAKLNVHTYTFWLEFKISWNCCRLKTVSIYINKKNIFMKSLN